MRIALALVTLAACSDGPLPGDGGPTVGYWSLETEGAFGGWSCSGAATSCDPPAPFGPAPTMAHVTGGRIEWVGAVIHRGEIAGPCLAVDAADEAGHARGAYEFCNATINGVYHDDIAVVAIEWDEGRASECSCFATFNHVGEN